MLEAAMAHHHAGRLREAEALYLSWLRHAPQDYAALRGLGTARCQLGRFAEGIAAFRMAAEQRPDDAEPQMDLGRAYRQLGQFAKAIARYGRALALDANNPQILNDRGVALAALLRYEEALTDYDRALTLRSGYFEALYNQGTALAALHRPAEALVSFERALTVVPDHPQALHNRANALGDLCRYEEAVHQYERLLALHPGFSDALLNRAAALLKLNRLEESLTDYRQVGSNSPHYADALHGCAAALIRLNRRAEARECVEKLLRMDPDRAAVAGWYLFESSACCAWDGYEQSVRQIIRDVRSGRDVIDPQRFLYLSESGRDQLLCARRHARALQGQRAPAPLWTGQRYDHPRIRIAYLSADFHHHATASLIAGLFEKHDQERFETIGASYGPPYQDAMRSRLKASMERFVDISRLDDSAASRLLRDLEIDLIVDLKGYTMDARPGILARRPAPIQVSYLGFPGTMGADFIDYLIADRTVIPESECGQYSERVVYLPDTYQANDDTRVIPLQVPTRAQLELPEDAFVFCAFNASQKITPPVFAMWMRLLRAVERSVLWLIAGESATVVNLRREAQRQGVEPGRLIFASRVAADEHLARHRLADLALDTLPCNAHTTASDALWAGLPMITCLGSTFAGRVGASLLRAVGLPELVTESLAAYERLAIDLARDAGKLGQLKARLAGNIKASPLFDTERFCRHIERAFMVMHARHQRGEKPVSFAIDAA
jgi:predicted O-linked N-acetylglucosamine transferase (SPINDLY family)